jgi:hypothetical protein
MSGRARRLSTRVTVVAGLTCVGAAIAFVPSAANAARPAAAVQTMSPMARLMAVQAQLDGIVSDVSAQASFESAPGFASLVVHQQANDITLYWHGSMPAAVRAAVSRQPRIVVKSAPFTKHALDNERGLIFSQQAHRSTKLSRRVQVTESGPAADARYLLVGVSGSLKLARTLPAIANSKVTVHLYHAADAVPLSRWNEGIPFKGGGWIANKTTGTACTSAFPAHFANDSSVNFMLTASHCVKTPVSEQAWYAGAGNGSLGLQMGVDWSVTPTNDGASIHLGAAFGTANGGGAHAIFTGGANKTVAGSSTETTSQVTGSGGNSNGDILCVSGSYSGAVCNNKVISNDWGWTLPAGLTHGSKVTQQSGKGAVGEGDSGGPVYMTVSGGVQARGIVSAGDPGQNGTCQGAQTGTCYSTWYFGNINPILAALNMAVNTN